MVRAIYSLTDAFADAFTSPRLGFLWRSERELPAYAWLVFVGKERRDYYT
jgi:hypothetical protein